MTRVQENFATKEQDEHVEKVNTELLKLLLECKDYSIVMLDATGRIISWNEDAAFMYGYKIEEIIYENEAQLYTLEDIEKGKPRIHLNLAIKNGKCEFETLKRKKNGSAFYTNNIISTRYNADKTVNGFAKITRDIDFQKKLEATNTALHNQLEEKVKQRTKELLTVNKELEAFSYSVSHDLRSPLRAISGYSTMLKKKYEAIIDDEGNRMIKMIVDKTRIMGLLIDDLLTFSRMARLEIVSDAIDMKTMAETCMNDLLQTETAVKYTTQILDMPECKGDSNMLKQVWYNLLSNAIKYSSKKTNPEIITGSVENSEMHIYYVKDNGAGFEMKYATKLFGVFQRLHRQDEFEGTGLGLALAKRIVSKHSGEIWAESILNEGTTFYFSIPKNLT